MVVAPAMKGPPILYRMSPHYKSKIKNIKYSLLADVDNIAEGVRRIITKPTSSNGHTHQSMENKDPSKEIDRVQSDRISQVLNSNLIRSPGHHGNNSENKRHSLRIRYKHLDSLNYLYSTTKTICRCIDKEALSSTTCLSSELLLIRFQIASFVFFRER